MVQLMNFYQRLYEDYSKLLFHPKLYCLSSHQLQDPTKIVARLISDYKFYYDKNSICLDPRGVFIVNDDKSAFLWIGKECHLSYKNKYIDYAKEYYNKLIEYEKAPVHLKVIFQEEEPIEFWNLFDLKSAPEEKYAYNERWDNWYLNLDDLQMISARSEKSSIEYAEREELMDRPAGFIYPNFIEPMYVMELDDLLEDTFMIV